MGRAMHGPWQEGRHGGGMGGERGGVICIQCMGLQSATEHCSTHPYHTMAQCMPYSLLEYTYVWPAYPPLPNDWQPKIPECTACVTHPPIILQARISWLQVFISIQTPPPPPAKAAAHQVSPVLAFMPLLLGHTSSSILRHNLSLTLRQAGRLP